MNTSTNLSDLRWECGCWREQQERNVTPGPSAIKLHTRQKMTAAALGAAGMLNLGKLSRHEA